MCPLFLWCKALVTKFGLLIKCKKNINLLIHRDQVAIDLAIATVNVAVTLHSASRVTIISLLLFQNSKFWTYISEESDVEEPASVEELGRGKRDRKRKIRLEIN